MSILLTDEIYDKPVKKNRKLGRLESLSLTEREHKPDLKNIVLNVFLDTKAEKMDTATDNGNSEIPQQRLFSFVTEIHSSKNTLYGKKHETMWTFGFTVFVWTTSIYLF